MSYIFKIDEFETKPNRLRPIELIIYGIWFSISAYNLYLSREAKNLLLFFVTLILLVITVMNTYFPNRTQRSFLNIEADFIQWKFKQIPNIQKVIWADIEWIKFEKDGISFYQKCSFNAFLNTDDMTDEQSVKLKTTVAEIAAEKSHL